MSGLYRLVTLSLVADVMDGTYMHEGANGAVHGGLVQVRVVQDNSRRLTTQLEQHRLDVLASSGSNDRADIGATGEVNLADGRVSDQGVGDSRGVGGLMEDDIQTSSGKTSLPEDVTNSPEALGRELGTLENNGVTSAERLRNGTDTKDERRIPVRQKSS